MMKSVCSRFFVKGSVEKCLISLASNLKLRFTIHIHKLVCIYNVNKVIIIINSITFLFIHFCMVTSNCATQMLFKIDGLIDNIRVRSIAG